MQSENFKWLTLGLCLLVSGLAIPTTGQVALPEIFNDNMVLQRDVPVQVWGEASAGEQIIVEFGEFKVRTFADDAGNWKVTLLPLRATGEQYRLIVSGQQERLVFHNVVVGEVWICPGQSNMHWPLHGSNGGEQEIDRADLPDLRLFNLSSDILPVSTAFDTSQLVRLKNKDYFQSTGWQQASPSTVGSFSAVAYHYGKHLLDSLQVPVGLIHNAIGGSTTESWVSKTEIAMDDNIKMLVDTISNWPDIEGIHSWVKERALENLIAWQDNDPTLLVNHPFAPGYLYETGIQPLIPFTFRGVIWYQGESNATHPDLYAHLMKRLIISWRTTWDQGDFPFLFVQLPNFTGRSRWPEMRSEQANLLSLPETSMAVIIDAGDPNDIHPRNKSVVGYRLALQALDEYYGYDLLSKGPELEGYLMEDSLVTFTFSNCDTLVFSGVPDHSGFFVQGYVESDTRETILPLEYVRIKGNTIIGQIPDGLLPVKFKYGWMPNPEVHYYNEAELPMAPFKIELPGNY